MPSEKAGWWLDGVEKGLEDKIDLIPLRVALIENAKIIHAKSLIKIFEHKEFSKDKWEKPSIEQREFLLTLFAEHKLTWEGVKLVLNLNWQQLDKLAKFCLNQEPYWLKISIFASEQSARQYLLSSVVYDNVMRKAAAGDEKYEEILLKFGNNI